MKKIISIIGARPQFIKHAPLQMELQKCFQALTIHTGQHYDPEMSEIFFNELKMPLPDYKLSLSASAQGEQTAKIMIGVEEIFIKEQPDLVLVYGDTNSTLAGAIVAAKLNIPIIHIEAGLRSFNREMPEEINRILTDHVSSMLFCPSEMAVKTLSEEGITEGVFITGDVMKDTLRLAIPFLKHKMDGNRYYFATIHRPYNADNEQRLAQLFTAFEELHAPVVFPIHPRTRKNVLQYGIQMDKYRNIRFIDPIGYFDSLSYQMYADAVITDSGGMQKEAYWLKKKCITIRKETEWNETLQQGHNTLIFDDLSILPAIIKETTKADFDETLYGVGNAAEQIVQLIKEKYA